MKQEWEIPLARKSDAETSKIAAEDIMESGAFDSQVAKVRAFVKRYPDRTASQLALIAAGGKQNAKYYRYEGIFHRRLGVVAEKGRMILCPVSNTYRHVWNLR